MPSTQLPSASNDYAAPQGMLLNKAAWDAAMTDLASRVRVIEGRAQNLQAVIDAGVGAALSMISQNVAPQITAVTGMISAMEAQIATAEDAVAALLATQLPAGNITFTPGGTLSSTNVQAAVAELASETATSLAAKADAAALTAKADAAAVYTKTQIDAILAATQTSYATVLKYS